MKTSIVVWSLAVVVLLAMLPTVQAVEYDTARDTQQQYVKEQLAELGSDCSRWMPRSCRQRSTATVKRRRVCCCP